MAEEKRLLKAAYPSETNRWKGKWIFQAKFHNTSENAAYARKVILRELDSELEKIAKNFPKRCDNYILATNVSLSSVKAVGTIDKIDEIKLKFSDKIKNIHVWGYQEISRYLDQYSDIRRTYSHLITPGDALNAAIQGKEYESRRNHQKEDIMKIFECWLTIGINPINYVYGSPYPPCFEDFYTEASYSVQRCDPYNEAMMHLKTGYYDSTFVKYRSLLDEVNTHNRNVARSTINIRKDTKRHLDLAIRSLKQCEDNQILVFDSY